MNIRIWGFVIVATFLSACGRAPDIDRSRATGVDSALGKTLTSSKWCTSASTDGVNRPKFTTLDLRQTGKFFRTEYVLNEDRSLSWESKSQGTWALILDKLFTQIDGHPREIQSKVTLIDDTSAAGQASAKTSAADKKSTTASCVQLAVFAREVETFCPCDFVDN